MHQFETTVDHRMTEQEAQAVLHVLAERERMRDGRPSIQDVASIANAPIADVQSALAEVRANFVPVEQPRQRTKNPMLPVLAFCSAVAILLFFVIGFFFLFSAQTVAPVEVTPPQPFPSPVQQEATRGPDAPTAASSDKPAASR